MVKRIECVVKGRVQRVTYRHFAAEEAKKLEITGVARNLSDGAVQIIAEGKEDALTAFIEELKKGPPLSKVERVDLEWREATGEFKIFFIDYNSAFDRIRSFVHRSV